MKPQLITSLIFLLLSLSFSGCFSIKEEIYLNKDGSGEYLVYTDMIEGSKNMMLGMMESMNPDADPDSLLMVVEDQLWQQYPSSVDSLIDFSSKIPDSIRNDPAKKKYLDKVEAFMKGSRELGYINSGMRFQFESMKDLMEIQRIVEESQQSSGDQLSMPTADVNFTFDGRSFSRTANFSEYNEEMNDSTMLALSSILKDSKWSFIVHLPKKAKEATEEQLKEKEGKDLMYEYDLIKIISGEQSMDMKVTF